MQKKKRKKKNRTPTAIKPESISKKFIAVTLGDPEGVGPEVVGKSLSAYSPEFPLIIIGSRDFYTDKSIPDFNGFDELPKHLDEGKRIFFHHIDTSCCRNNFGEPQGDLSYEYVKTGIEWALSNEIQGLVTAPISKEKWLKAGIKYEGHTQLLAETAGVKDYSMFFWSDDLKVALFTIHIPLKQIFEHIREDRIVHFLRFLVKQLSRLFPGEFSLLVSGLNPHSGENGYLGTEEIDTIIPAIKKASADTGISIQGPFPPDVVFLKAKETKNAVVVTWYHDQGLIPFKLLNIHSGVNMTLGLPYVRTSPDHGTAYDIAGKGIANPSSMTEAIKLAERLISQR